MKCDMNLVRKILLEIENRELGRIYTDIEIDSYSREQIYYHCYIMLQEGLIEGTMYPELLCGTSPQAIPKNLTWKGHEFIEAARNDTLWKKAITIAQEKGVSITIPVISQLLTSLIKNQLGLH